MKDIDMIKPLFEYGDNKYRDIESENKLTTDEFYSYLKKHEKNVGAISVPSIFDDEAYKDIDLREADNDKP